MFPLSSPKHTHTRSKKDTKPKGEESWLEDKRGEQMSGGKLSSLQESPPDSPTCAPESAEFVAHKTHTHP